MLSQQLEEKLENFSSLSDQECVSIISGYLLEALESDVYIDWEIVTKFIVLPFPARNDLRKILNLALRSNRQMIGIFSIGQWIEKYRKTYENIERTPNTFFEFVSSDTEIKKLDRKSQIKLMRILRLYDYLLVEPINGLTDVVMKIIKFPMYVSSPESAVSQAMIEENKNYIPRLEKTTIDNMLRNYPALGEQLITSEKIKLQNFPEPVRPSIKNWLADYTFNLGYENRGAIQRGTYLFQSINTRRLSPGDRQKLQYILKAYDENLPVPINPNTNQIVFSEVSFGGNPAEIRPAARAEEKDGNMRFSYPQKLPYERKDSPNVIRPEERSQPLPKNVVNLKDNGPI